MDADAPHREYPVAGAGAVEATDENSAIRKNRGFIFAMIGDLSANLGFVFGSLVPLLVLLCFHQEVRHYEAVWRVSLAMGVIPPLTIFWFRYRMTVSSAYRKSSMRKQRVPYWLAVKRYWRPLLGVCASWFIYNYISYPFGLFSSTILTRVNVGSSLTRNMGWGTLINCFYIPGSFIGGYLSDRIGRRQTMALGFFLQAILGFILGGALGQIQTVLPLFIVLYGIFLTLGEVGPGATIVLTSSENFPTSIRGHAVGFAAAWSKAGATIGTQVFKPILAHWGDDELRGTQAVFLIGSGFAVLGALVAFFVLEDPDKVLDNIDADWKEYLRQKGYEDIQWGDRAPDEPVEKSVATM
jgi:MFS family permease